MGAFAKYKNLEYKMRETAERFADTSFDTQSFITIGNPYWAIKMDESDQHTFRVCKVDECVSFIMQFNDRGGLPCVTFNIPSFGTFSIQFSEDNDKLFTDDLRDKIFNQTHYFAYGEYGCAVIRFVEYLENNYRVRRNYIGT